MVRTEIVVAMRSRSVRRRWLAATAVLGVLALGFALAWYRKPPAARAVPAYGLCLVDRRGAPLSGEVRPLKLVLDPFAVYCNLPNQRTERCTIDAYGRRRGFPNPGQPTIAILGGSAAFGEQLPSDEATLAWQLGASLPDYAVVNAAVIGYLSGQELALMVHHLDDDELAGYVVLDGWNELFDQDTFHPRRPGEFGVNNTFLVLQERLVAAGGDDRAPAAPSATPPDPEGTFAQIQRSYQRNLEKMQAFARGQGRFLLVAFQPELGSKRHRTPQEEEALGWWDRAYGYSASGFSEKYARFIGAAKTFCELRGIECIDLNREPEFVEATATLFYDVVHPNQDGHALIARILHRRLEPLLRSVSAGRGRPESDAPRSDCH